MLSTRAPLLDCEAITADVLRRISERAPTLRALARRHLARLTPDRWTMEWHLPAWLGHRLDLDPELVAALSRSNVLGLLAVRLEDDLEDGEVPAHEIADTEALARLAYEAAIAGYDAWFDRGSPVWLFLADSLAARRAGATGPDLEERGAPIKIAGFACCLHADRLDLWPALDRALGRAVTALVLYDHFWDWESDVAAGRWNAFVAGLGAGQVPALAERNRSAVLTAMLTRDVVRPHFDEAVRAATEAAAIATDLDIPELEAFLTSWAERAEAQGAQVAEHYRQAGDRASSLLFGTKVGGAAT